MHLALFSSRKNRTNVNNLFSVTYKFPKAKLNHARNISGNRGQAMPILRPHNILKKKKIKAYTINSEKMTKIEVNFFCLISRSNFLKCINIRKTGIHHFLLACVV